MIRLRARTTTREDEMMRRKQQPTLQELRDASFAFAKSYLHDTALGLPSTLDEEQFGKVMDAVMQGLISAWAAGYAHAQQ